MAFAILAWTKATVAFENTLPTYRQIFLSEKVDKVNEMLNIMKTIYAKKNPKYKTMSKWKCSNSLSS